MTVGDWSEPGYSLEEAYADLRAGIEEAREADDPWGIWAEERLEDFHRWLGGHLVKQVERWLAAA